MLCFHVCMCVVSGDTTVCILPIFQVSLREPFLLFTGELHWLGFMMGVGKGMNYCGWQSPWMKCGLENLCWGNLVGNRWCWMEDGDGWDNGATNVKLVTMARVKAQNKHRLQGE